MERAVLVEIFVAAVEEADDVLWFFGEVEQLFAHGVRNDAVVHAVQDQERRGDFGMRSSERNWSFIRSRTGMYQ